MYVILARHKCTDDDNYRTYLEQSVAATYYSPVDYATIGGVVILGCI